MDLVSMAASIMAAKAGALQQQVATSTLKSNLDAQKSTVLTLLGAGQQAPADELEAHRAEIIDLRS